MTNLSVNLPLSGARALQAKSARFSGASIKTGADAVHIKPRFSGDQERLTSNFDFTDLSPDFEANIQKALDANPDVKVSIQEARTYGDGVADQDIVYDAWITYKTPEGKRKAYQVYVDRDHYVPSPFLHHFFGVDLGGKVQKAHDYAVNLFQEMIIKQINEIKDSPDKDRKFVLDNSELDREDRYKLPYVPDDGSWDVR